MTQKVKLEVFKYDCTVLSGEDSNTDCLEGVSISVKCTSIPLFKM